MRLRSVLLAGTMLVGAAAISAVAAGFAVSAVEDGTEIAVRERLDAAGLTWAEVQADGLRVILSGTAPTEALRFQALSAAGAVVDAARVINETGVAAAQALAAPAFSVEILRNDRGVSLIGLVPADTDRAAIVRRLTDLADGGTVSDLLQTADYPEPDGWTDALGFAEVVLALLPRSKISVDAGYIAITAIADSTEDKRRLENELAERVPPGVRLALDIAAPRPVLTPFTLRFVIDAEGSDFDACSADTEVARARIIAAGRAAGVTGNTVCVVGLGVPTPRWSEATIEGIEAVARLGRGSITFADADVTLIAARGTPPQLFDRVVGELETALPDVFALHAVLPEPETDESVGPDEFTVTLSPEGLVQLRGRVPDAALRDLADSLAKARFGSDNVYTAARVVPGLPQDWSLRVLTGVEALSWLENGVVVVAADQIEVRGMTHRDHATDGLSQLFVDKLGAAQDFALDVVYEPPPPPADLPPTPEECDARIQATLALGKISFEPGSATIDAGSYETMNALAEIIGDCDDLPIEIQGHTDSQGREEMNQNLSQARAQSVLSELRARRVPTARFTAVGYGETRPVADNGTEEGREANRRIEFVLIRPEQTEDTPSALDEIAEEAIEAQDAPAEETGDEPD